MWLMVGGRNHTLAHINCRNQRYKNPVIYCQACYTIANGKCMCFVNKYDNYNGFGSDISNNISRKFTDLHISDCKKYEFLIPF